jgi:hypothetical protein
VNCYPFIEAEKAGRRNVARACALLQVSRAAFYSHLSGPSRREQEYAELTGQIKAVHDESKAATARCGCMLSCAAAAAGTPASAPPG